MKRMTHEWKVLALLLCIGMVSTGLAQNTSDSQLDETVLEWPRVEVSEVGAVVQYQPQITSWDNFQEITASMAISVIPYGETERVFGSMRVKAYCPFFVQITSTLTLSTTSVSSCIPVASRLSLIGGYLENQSALPIPNLGLSALAGTS